MKLLKFLPPLIVLLLIVILVVLVVQKESSGPISSEREESLEEESLLEEPKPSSKKTSMNLVSPAFENESSLPSKYTCDSENISPPLAILDVPEAAKSLVLIVDDPDASSGDWVHWLVWNIDPATSFIKENAFPQGAIQGLNDFGKHEYGGPCPPSGTHRYFFKLYALDSMLALGETSRKADLLREIEGRVLLQAELIGIYKRK